MDPLTFVSKLFQPIKLKAWNILVSVFVQVWSWFIVIIIS